MKVGSVYPGGEAIVPVRLRGAGGLTVEFPAVVDTGFNDWLTLSFASIRSLGLSFREEDQYTIAGESRVVTRLFEAEVDWFGRWRRILVTELAGDPLLGMAMLRGFFLGIDVIDGGPVEIRPLDTQ